MVDIDRISHSAVPAGFVRGPHGRPFRCNPARHDMTLAQFGAYEVIARIVNLANIERENQELIKGGASVDDLEHAILRCPIGTVADAMGISKNAAREHLENLTAKGWLKRADGRGWFPTYYVITHIERSLRDGCPACRFDAAGHVAQPRKDRARAARFGKHSRRETVCEAA